MSPRITRLRKVLNPLVAAGFKPYGPESSKRESEPVILLYEEYEALRLSDYDNYNHHQASQLMDVSLSTFPRIYSSTRQKIAKSLVEGGQIIVEGGKVYFESDWYHCENCNCYFNNPEREKEVENCPLCNSWFVIGYDYDNTLNETDTSLKNDDCICTECGFEQSPQFGKPCSQQVCPECKSIIKRKGTHYCKIEKK